MQLLQQCYQSIFSGFPSSPLPLSPATALAPSARAASPTLHAVARSRVIDEPRSFLLVTLECRDHSVPARPPFSASPVARLHEVSSVWRIPQSPLSLLGRVQPWPFICSRRRTFATSNAASRRVPRPVPCAELLVSIFHRGPFRHPDGRHNSQSSLAARSRSRIFANRFPDWPPNVTVNPPVQSCKPYV